MGAKRLSCRVHSGIEGLIRKLPTILAVFALRAYDKILRTLDGEYRTTTYFGAHMYCNSSDLIQFFIFHFGVWEPDVSRVIERNLEPGDVFVDAGANVGYYTLLGSRRVGPEGAVISIEASPSTFATLKRNLAINRETGNVRAVNVALSDKPGRLDLFLLNKLNIGAATTVRHRSGKPIATVDARPLTGILTQEELSRLRLIKVDVEGAELPVLRDLLDNLARCPETMDLVVEANPDDDRDGWRNMFERLRAAGFVAYEIASAYDKAWYLNWRRPSPLRQIEALPAHFQDLLFTRRQTAP